jgi:PAS domain S-box-containing protein
MVASPILPDDRLLQALLKDSLHGLILYQIVRDEDRKPIDFRYQLVNPVAASLLGACSEELIGRSCQEVFPQGDDLRYCYQQVALTGQNLRVDYQLPLDGRWFEVLITGQGQETLLCFFTDITERVQAEQELIKHLTLLQQTEELTGISSWDYDRFADRFFWSEGMYRLFGIEPGAPVSLQTYIAYTIQADQLVAQCLVERLTVGNLPFDLALRIQRQGQVRSLKIKGVVKADKHGRPVWVLGICSGLDGSAELAGVEKSRSRKVSSQTKI